MLLLPCGACVGFFGMTFYGRGVVRSFSIVACLSGHKGADGRLVVDQNLVTPCPASLPRVTWKLHELPVIVFSDAGYNSRNATPAGDKEVEAAILRIKAHRPWKDLATALDTNADIMSETDVLERYPEPRRVGDTDTGTEIREQLADLHDLLDAYRSGALAEHGA